MISYLKATGGRLGLIINFNERTVGEGIWRIMLSPSSSLRAWRLCGSIMFKIGQGFDVHALVYGRKLLIGGVDIPNPKGLLGHSDGDVLLTGDLRRAAGAPAGDIGQHFPDTDGRYKGADSLELLREVGARIGARASKWSTSTRPSSPRSRAWRRTSR